MGNNKKQEIVTGNLNFNNMSPDKDFGKASRTKDSKEPVDKLVTIKFKVHKVQIEYFHLLKIDYARSNKIFNLSSNEMFAMGILFLADKYKNLGILKPCPTDFKDAIIRPGKRKATERTFPFTETDAITFTIKNSIADIYMDIMFSYISNDPNDDLFNDHHSRTYFFYDFIDELKSNKKELLNYDVQ